MTKQLIFYATEEGQTRRIAEAIAVRLNQAGYEAAALDILAPEASTLARDAPVFILGAPVRVGQHPKAAKAFVMENASVWRNRPSAFFSVSLSAVSPDPRGREGAMDNLHAFLKKTGWAPSIEATLGGTLAYTKYDWLTKQVMRAIAKVTKAPTDVSRDHELTDWKAVEAFADRIAELVATTEAPRRMAG